MKAKEILLKCKAKQLGLNLKKSRGLFYSRNNKLGYMITNPKSNTIVWGNQYDIYIKDVEILLELYESGVS
jgi:hypothetical protein